MRRADNRTTSMCRLFFKSGSPNLLETSEPAQACNGINLPFLSVLLMRLKFRVLIENCIKYFLLRFVNYAVSDCAFLFMPREPCESVPVAARSKAWVCGRSRAEIVGWNPTGGMSVSCEGCVLLGRGLCDELITRPEESYRLWCSLGVM